MTIRREDGECAIISLSHVWGYVSAPSKGQQQHVGNAVPHSVPHAQLPLLTCKPPSDMKDA